MTAPSTILVGRIGKVFWLRVEGRGTFQNSVQVKKALQAVVANGTHNLVVDLERCPMMDSTFLGTLTGAALHLREKNGGSLSVLNANPRNLQLLSDLGLDHIMEVDSAGNAWPQEREMACAQLATCGEKGASNKLEHTQHILKAHQTLADMSNMNEGRFRDVIYFLEKELEEQPELATS
ncbi:anti-anti-sigma factor [Prosthecobacter fusiformis]|uniref:Anti-anti-sigma factor n=1 Tax=Prosthecobacter fusiformis TaxID=48464 RepID=A0A4R7RZH2_9BACT|nr:STAS domain-containing protein [Prosthecobacter fusiformis]TDU71332.1 anti-anti-sigma factor [Prosthecobacter fusiformis]